MPWVGGVLHVVLKGCTPQHSTRTGVRICVSFQRNLHRPRATIFTSLFTSLHEETVMRILLAGATGLVGQGVLRECLRAADVTHVTTLGRRPSGQSDTKVEDLVVADFTDMGAVEDRLRSFDACLYCAGAPPIGTAEAEYRHVTLDLTTHVAQTLARLNPGLTFVYIS